MTPHQIKLVQTSFSHIAPIATIAADLFYGRLFEMAPELRRLFPSDLSEQKKKLMAMLRTVVCNLDRLDTVLPAVRALGRRHAGYGAHEEHFAPVGAALLWTLEQGLGDGFTSEVKEAWATAYGILSRAMIDAANRERLAA
ncbi:MAG TPA: globin family protein [Reyranella sp.]|nr:globin family protein [Reyranella sp.]